MIENTELIIKGNTLVQRKTLDLPLENSEKIFTEFINRQQKNSYAPCSTDYFSNIYPDFVEKSWMLSKDFSQDFTAVHKVKHFPINHVYGWRLNDREQSCVESRGYWFTSSELVQSPTYSVNYIASNSYDTDTEFLEDLDRNSRDNVKFFPNNQILWSDPRFDLFVANFFPESPHVYFFAIEAQTIDFANREMNRVIQSPRIPVCPALPNIYDNSKVCMGYDYDEAINDYGYMDKQLMILDTIQKTSSNRDLDVDGTKANMTVDENNKSIPIHKETIYRADNYSTVLSASAPFREITNSNIIQFAQTYINNELF